jgi:enamine deaminase RidA (YjgF/YER057c/UK114 family)
MVDKLFPLVTDTKMTQREQRESLLCLCVEPWGQAAGTSLARLLHVTIYLTDIADRPAFNEVYARRVPQPVPARCCVAVSALAVEGMRVEITACAGL